MLSLKYYFYYFLFIITFSVNNVRKNTSRRRKIKMEVRSHQTADRQEYCLFKRHKKDSLCCFTLKVFLSMLTNV